jgi:carbamoyl-phosphate synthase small subunit
LDVLERMNVICKLALENATVFTGRAVGAAGTRSGEVVFNTAMTGYQEVFTDPSYCGQIVTMTFPLQGNYGVNPEDFEATRVYLSGVVLRELPRRPSNYRARLDLPGFLEQHGIIGIAGVDTRALTRSIRVQGALRGVISTEAHDEVELVRLAQTCPGMLGANHVQAVAPHEIGTWDKPLWRFADDTPRVATKPRSDEAPQGVPRCHIVAIDCGTKHNILRYLVDQGCRVTTVPADATAAQICELAPDGVLIGNGPGDPAAVTDTVETLRALLGKFPIFGICLGHQLLAIALGAKTYKLRFGHHGANLPVLNRHTGRVEVTSQNHGFAVDAASLERAGGTVTHVNLNDDTLEGFLHRDQGVIAIQYHPEASPGPHDGSYMFARFVDAVAEHRLLDVDALA